MRMEIIQQKQIIENVYFTGQTGTHNVVGARSRLPCFLGGKSMDARTSESPLYILCRSSHAMPTVAGAQSLHLKQLCSFNLQTMRTSILLAHS